MQCGFSLTQIGEFAFIIASLGVSLHVTSDFLYPIVVAVSVITTFLTPYMIRLAEPASDFADRHLPESWKSFLARYSSGPQTVNHENLVAETSFRHGPYRSGLFHCKHLYCGYFIPVGRSGFP